MYNRYSVLGQVDPNFPLLKFPEVNNDEISPLSEEAQEVFFTLGFNQEEELDETAEIEVFDNETLDAISANPELALAARTLNQMLQSEPDATSANRLLELLGSRFERNQNQGQQILALLNDNGQTALARRILAVPDSGYRDTLLQMHSNPLTRAAVPRILSWSESNDQQSIRNFRTLMNNIHGVYSSERAIGQQLTRLLSNNETANLSAIILDNFRSFEDLKEVCSLFNGTRPESSVQAVRTLLSGSNDDVRRLKTLVRLRLFQEPGNWQKTDPRPEPPRIDHRPTADSLLAMLNSDIPFEQSAARTLIDNVRDFSHYSRLMPVVNDPGRRDAVRQLLQMLASDRAEDNARVNLVLRAMIPSPPPQPPIQLDTYLDRYTHSDRSERRDKPRTQPAMPPSVRTVLSMLAASETRDEARAALSSVNTPSDLSRLLSLDAATRRALIALENPTAMTAVLNNLSNENIERLSSLLRDPEQRALANALIGMLPDSGEGVSSFLEHLQRPETQRLKQMLLSPAGNNDARAIIRLVPQGTWSTIFSMLDSPANQTHARNLLELMETNLYSQGAAGIFEMMAQPATRPQGQRVLALLNGNIGQREQARALIAGMPSSHYAGMFALMDTPNQTSAASLIMELIASPETRGRGIELLSPARPDCDTTRQLFTMLNNPSESQIARAMITSLSPPARSYVLSILNDPSKASTAQQLRQLLLGNQTQQHNIESTLNSINFVRAARVVEMLGRDSDRDLANFMLSNISNEHHLRAFANLATNSTNRRAADNIRNMLQSGDSVRVQSANTLLAMHSGELQSLETARRLVDMLNSPDTTQRAERILSLAEPARVIRLHQMLDRPAGQAVLAMLTGTERERVQATALLRTELEHEAIGRLLSISSNPSTSQAAQNLLERARREPYVVRDTLELISSTPGPNADRILRMLADPNSERFELALSVRHLNGQAGTCLDILENPQHLNAARELRRLLSPSGFLDTDAVRALLDLLSLPATRTEGERLLAMLGERENAETAVRALRTRAFENWSSRVR